MQQAQDQKEPPTPLRPSVKQNSIRRRIIRPSHQPDLRSKVPKEPEPVVAPRNIFAQLPRIKGVEAMGPAAPTPQAIRQSELYQRLLSEIEQLTEAHNREMAELKQTETGLDKHLAASSTHLYSIKMEIWELRNSLMENRAALEEEEHYYADLLRRGVDPDVAFPDREEQPEQENNEDPHYDQEPSQGGLQEHSSPQ